jgi:hypothetical protein
LDWSPRIEWLSPRFMAGDCEVQSSIPTGGARSGAGDGTGRDAYTDRRRA